MVYSEAQDQGQLKCEESMFLNFSHLPSCVFNCPKYNQSRFNWDFKVKGETKSTVKRPGPK